MKDYWEWTATDRFGGSRTYQAAGPSVTEAAMLEMLQSHFRNVVITNLRRITEAELKPADGIIEAHTYKFGAIEQYRRELGLLAPLPRPQPPPRLESLKERYQRLTGRRSILDRA